MPPKEPAVTNESAVMSTRLFAMPGVTLMDVSTAGDGVHVWCPGCCAEHVFPRDSEAVVFVHADNGCPVHREIEAALLAFRDGAAERVQ